METEDSCNICGDSFDEKCSTTLVCNHKYHYECIQKTFMYDRKRMNSCPLCRKPSGMLPLVNGLQKLIRGIHYINTYPESYNPGKCSELLKSGKRKGCACGVKCALGQTICKRHHTAAMKKQAKLKHKESMIESMIESNNDLNTNQQTIVV
jgi:hypothetical protein